MNWLLIRQSEYRTDSYVLHFEICVCILFYFIYFFACGGRFYCKIYVQNNLYAIYFYLIFFLNMYVCMLFYQLNSHMVLPKRYFLFIFCIFDIHEKLLAENCTLNTKIVHDTHAQTLETLNCMEIHQIFNKWLNIKFNKLLNIKRKNRNAFK